MDSSNDSEVHRTQQTSEKEWKQTDLDLFIAQNDWGSIMEYIAYIQRNFGEALNNDDKETVPSPCITSSSTTSYQYSQNYASTSCTVVPSRKIIGVCSHLQHPNHIRYVPLQEKKTWIIILLIYF